MTDVTMRQLLEVGVHFGHQTRFWCPKMSPYIYGHRNKIHIINLEQTLTMFNDAMNYLSAVASKRGSIMFVGTKTQAGAIVQEQAKRASSPYVYHRWLGGMLTNYSTVRQSIDRLNALEETMGSQDFGKMSKKEGLRVQREHFRLNRNLAGIREMKGLPEALFVIDVKHENIAVKEANKLGIPVVAVVDTNCDPEGIDYIIPGNDDSISAIRLYCSYAADAVLDGHASNQTQPFHFAMDAEDGSEGVVTTVVTPAKAAVAPDDDDVQETPEVASDSAAADAESETAEVAVDETEPVPEAESESAQTDQASEETPETGSETESETKKADSADAQVENDDDSKEESDDKES